MGFCYLPPLLGNGRASNYCRLAAGRIDPWRTSDGVADDLWWIFWGEVLREVHLSEKISLYLYFIFQMFMKIPDLDPKFEAMFEKLVKETVITNNKKLDNYGTETGDIKTEDGRCYTVCTSVSPKNSTWSTSLGINFWLGV